MVLLLTDLASQTLYTFSQPTIRLGRHSQNDIIIKHNNISRHHCSISYSGEDVFLCDLDSEEGTYYKADDF